MNNKKLSSTDMKAKTKIKVCSTPERRIDSPTIDNDSICDSETESPIPFLCTQDDADVFYNFYTPKAEAEKSKLKTTPVSRKTKKPARLQTDKQLPKRKIIKPSQQRNKLLQELKELYQNVHEIEKKSSTQSVENEQSEEDLFSDTSVSSDISPRGGVKFQKRCLRKNVLSSKFLKPEPECGLESDDSINECLIQVSQAVEEKMNYEKKLAKRQCFGTLDTKSLKTAPDNYIDQDSMDNILSNINLESPHEKKLKHCDSPQYCDDSFDSLLGILNDSTLDRLSQMPVKNAMKTKDFTKVKLEEPNNDSQLLNSFVRHNSMPVSPSTNKPSTSGMTLGRYKSMPFNKSSEDIHDNSQIKYTTDEINIKRQQAREKLLAKGMLRSSKQQLTQTQSTINNNFQLHDTQNTFTTKKNILTKPTSASDSDMKLIIEKKRQEALMKLRKRQAQCR